MIEVSLYSETTRSADMKSELSADQAPVPKVKETFQRAGRDCRRYQVTRWFSVSVCALIFLLPAPVLAIGLTQSPWRQIADTVGVDPFLLYAIALTESGRPEGKNLIAPWPWALNIEGQAFFPASRDEAINLLAAHHGKSVDVGLMQVNSKWHGHRVTSLHDLLEPTTNLKVGAAILREALDSEPGNLTVGLGRYHSASPERGRAYAQTVIALYRYLIHNEKTGVFQ